MVLRICISIMIHYKGIIPNTANAEQALLQIVDVVEPRRVNSLLDDATYVSVKQTMV